MRLRIWALGVAALLTPPAFAQRIACPPAADAATLGPPQLHLSASATVQVAPDELVADLSALGNSPTAVAAQRRVNTLVAEAAKAADTVASVKAAFRDYSVQFVDAPPAHWVAQQTVELRGRDGPALLDLVGQLQALGLAIGSLDWQVSPARADAARQEATIAALKRLRSQAAVAAQALGVELDHYQSVRLNTGPHPIPYGRAVPAMMAMAAPMPPPSASPTEQDVIADVDADVVLRPPAARSSEP
jgi:uncharacterized protein YggE